MLDEIMQLVEKLSDSKIAEKDEKGNIKTEEATRLEAVNDAVSGMAAIRGMLLEFATEYGMAGEDEFANMLYTFDPANENGIKFQREYADGLARTFGKIQDSASDLYDTAVNIVNACEYVRDSSSLLMKHYKDLERAESTTKKLEDKLFADIGEIGK